MSSRATLIPAVVGAAGLLLMACASSPNAMAREDCGLTRADSAYAGAAGLYDACSVDRPAQVLTRPTQTFMPTGTPPAGTTCYTAEVRFVVGADGRPERETIRLVSTTYDPYARTIVASVPAWRYRPAELNGEPVRQVVTLEMGMAVRVSLVRAGTRPPDRPPRC